MALDNFAEIAPLTYRAAYPRRIIPPTGFISSKYYALNLLGQIKAWEDPAFRLTPHITGYINALLQLSYGVPTYFVDEKFCQAVAQTDPPEDFKLSELKWPLPALLFVLPTSFSLHYFKYHVPFISVTYAKEGIYPKCLKLPECEVPFDKMESIQNQGDKINICFPIYGNPFPVDYTASYIPSMQVKDLINIPFEDATYIERQKIGIILECQGFPSAAEEKTCFDKVRAFALKLMLALTAQPAFVNNGSLQRPHKIKKGKVIKELWSANTIGFTYKPKMSLCEGSHASPRMHWRRGHMRNQPYGPKHRERKLIWIEPVLVNAPDPINS